VVFRFLKEQHKFAIETKSASLKFDFLRGLISESAASLSQLQFLPPDIDLVLLLINSWV